MAEPNETVSVRGAAEKLGATPKLTELLSGGEAVLAPLRERRKTEEERLTTLGGDIEKRKIESAVTSAQQEAQAKKERREEIERDPVYASFLEAQREAVDMAGKAFVPSRANAMELATVFALVNIAGFAMGSGGKRNAQAAMSGMNGMLEGYQKGRADIYKKEKDAFETNVKALKTKVDTLKTAVDEISRRADLTLSQKIDQIKIEALKRDADFVAKYVEKEGIVKTIKALDEQIANVNRVNDFVIKEKQLADRRIEEAKIRAEERQFQRRLAAETTRARMTVGKKQLMQGSDGKMYSYDPETQQFSPVALPAGVETVTKPGSKAGQNALTFASRVYGNIENSAADLKNIIALPATSQLPVLSGLLNVERDTALGSIQSLAARKITNAENRAFQQVSDQLGAALSRMEAQGLATGATKANIAAFNSLRPAAGDNAINMAIYLARVKQEIETGIRVHNKMPGATAEQKAATQLILQDLNQVVPFSVDDTLEVLRKSKKPLGDKMSQLVRQPTVADNLNITVSPQPSTAPQAAPATTNIEAERSSARAAIAAGKDEAAVRARFKQRTGQEL